MYTIFVYWISTLLLVLCLAIGAVLDLGQASSVLESLSHLGYPKFLAPILGVWKVLGSIAILIPGFQRLKEWAYAGVFFDLSGAFLSHVIVGDEFRELVPIIAILGFALISWATRPITRRLQ
ncbi:DoxX family protein [Leptospira andrefontaineae]|nr:DoxX family protein [Leptospira andrefontaineae]